MWFYGRKSGERRKHEDERALVGVCMRGRRMVGGGSAAGGGVDRGGQSHGEDQSYGPGAAQQCDAFPYELGRCRTGDDSEGGYPGSCPAGRSLDGTLHEPCCSVSFQ